MKIADSSVLLSASSRLDISTTKQQRLEYWLGERSGTTRGVPDVQLDSVNLSSLAKKLSLEAAKSTPGASPADVDGAGGELVADLSDKDMQKLMLIEEFMYKLTGKRFKFLLTNRIKLKGLRINGQDGATAAAQAPQRAGYGLIYDSVEQHSEKQAMEFQASGAVRTADGREIALDVSLSMSREFQSSTEIHVRAGDAKIDPLVINLDRAAPALTQRNFRFDLDSDGDEEQIARLMPGSGFLALDRNGDGAVNDGSELFGPRLGDGFAELAAYDSDGNGWIDENDPVYDKLRIWMADGNGDMKLFALGQKGVGALYLGHVSSAFDLRDAGNGSLGTVQSTGVFLRENGSAGTLQHIDLTV